jgi:sorbitol-specific phosphotransferase system component IIA
MGKKTIYVCDVCDVEVVESQPNMAVQMTHTAPTNREARIQCYVCEYCVTNKSTSQIIKKVIQVAQAETALTAVGSVSLDNVDSLGVIVGIARKA